MRSGCELASLPATRAWRLLLVVGRIDTLCNIVEMLIQKRTVSLPPALTILSQTILGTLFGPLGLGLATPLMAALLVAVRMIYVESFLEGEDSNL